MSFLKEIRFAVRINLMLKQKIDLYSEMLGSTKTEMLINWLEDLEYEPGFTKLERQDKTYNFHIPPTLLARIDTICEAKKISRSSYIRNIIRQGVDSFKQSRFSNREMKQILSEDRISMSSGLATRSDYYYSLAKTLHEENGEVLFLMNPITFYRQYSYQYDFENYIPKRLSLDISARGLLTYTQAFDDFPKLDKELNRITKFVPYGISFQNNVVIAKDKIFFLEGKHNAGIMLSDPLFTSNFKDFFEDLWKLSC